MSEKPTDYITPQNCSEQELLRRSEAWLARSQEIAHLGSWELDLEKNELNWSDEVYRIFGLAPQEFGATYEAFLEHVHPEDRALVDDAYSGSIRQGKDTYEVEHRVIRARTGEVRWVQEKCKHERSEDGKIIRSVGMVLDITERKQAEAVVRESEAKYRSLFEHMLEGFAYCKMLFDKDGRPTDFLYLTVNDSFGSLTGLKNVVGRKVTEVIPGIKDLNPELFEIYGRVALTGKPENFEIYFKPLARDLSVSVYSPVKGHFVAVFDDITERKRTENAVRERERLLQTVIDGSTSPIFLKDLDGKFITINSALERMLGISRDEIKGKTDYDIAPKEVADYWSTHDKQVMATRKAIQIEEVANLPDGHHIFLANKFPLVDVDGQICGVGAISHDITERKRAEEALREAKEQLELRVQDRTAELTDALGALRQSEQEFRILAEAMPQIVWTTRADGWNTYFNHQWVDYTGLTLEESCGHGWNKPFHPEDQQRAWDAWQNAVTNLASYALECRLRRADGVYRWWLIRGVPVLDEKGIVLKWFGTCTDIEDLKRAEEALRRANADLDRRASQLRALTGELTLAEQRERSRLANVLHDHLQQMLVAAKFRLTVLGRGGDDVVKQATKEVEELIDESILASRSLTAELSPPILHEAGLNEGLQWLARRMVDTHGLFVNLEFNESGPLPEDLKILLFQSVRELLFNVVKHANTRSAVVNLRRLDGALQVTVSDQGSGFDPDTMPLAGEGGRGFGLLGIQERLKYMGGNLEIGSNPGKGSRFVLSVPIIPALTIEPNLQGTLVSPEAHLIASEHPNSGRKIRVLIADDHAIFRQGIANLLADEPDIEVVGEAADGREAADLAAKLLPDIILMDMSMPKLNGVEATRIIHNDWPEIRIIGLSMFEEEDRSRAMRDAGAVDYVTKSGPVEILLNVIRTSIRASHKVLSAKT